MTPLYANLFVLGLGFALALGMILVGALRVLSLVKALKKRLAEYRALPVMRYVEVTKRQIASATRRFGVAAALPYRASAALRDIANARAKIVAIVTSPSAIWRLGELLVTGK